MLAAFARLFLLVLLACDYAGDPYFGQSPLSHVLGSQEVVCSSLHCCNGHREVSQASPAVAQGTVETRPSAVVLHQLTSPPIPPPLTGAERIIVLRSFRR
jgi:hypothetical protein